MAGSRRVSGTERAQLLRYAAAITVLEEKELDKFFGELKNGKRDLALIRKVGWTLFERAVSAMPIDQVKQLKAHLGSVRITVGITQLSIKDFDERYGQFLTFSALESLADGCRDHCMMCQLDKHEAKRCPVRAALDELTVERVEDAATCPYMGM